jgi:hypothetical protein
MKTKFICFLLILSFPAIVFAECEKLEGCIREFNDLNRGNSALNINQPCQNKNSDSTEEQGKDWHYILGGVAMAPFALVLGTTIHEGSHALAAKAYGAEITEFRVIPFYDEERKRSYFGRTGYNYGDKEVSDSDRAWVSSAPMFTDAALISVCSGLAFSGTLPKNKWAKTGLTVFCLLPTIDFINHIRATSEYADLVKIEKTIAKYNPNISESDARLMTRIPMGVAIAVGATASGFMLYDLFKKEDSKKEKEDKLIHNFKLAPSFSPSFTGMNMGFSF